jgi:membrane dipeptidase
MFRTILFASVMAATPAVADDLAVAAAALQAAPIIDGHNDLPYALRGQNGSRLSDFDFAKLPDRLKGKIVTDYASLTAGHVGGQFWSVYVPAETEGAEAVRQTFEQIDIADRLIAANPDKLVKTGTAAEVERAIKAGRIASLYGAEGGHSIGNSLAVLRQLYAAGVRYMTLTHSKTTMWADSATDAPRHNGLAPFGKAVVAEMNRLGMLVDLSHVSPKAMHDAIDIAEAPVIFSHSSARAVTDHPRNVPDDVLTRLKANGGIVMVTFVEPFVSEARRQWNAAQEAEKARAASLHSGRPDLAEAALKSWEAANPMPKATVADIADHVDHVKRTVGVDHIGIGGDLDGIPTYPTGLAGPADYPNLFAELVRRGYTKADLAKIASGNVLRVLRQAEAAAARLQTARRPDETLFTEK